MTGVVSSYGDAMHSTEKGILTEMNLNESPSLHMPDWGGFTAYVPVAQQRDSPSDCVPTHTHTKDN